MIGGHIPDRPPPEAHCASCGSRRLRPLVSFPQKFYCGTYQIELDLSAHPDVAHLRTQWKVSRWGRGAPEPLFGFYLFAQETVGALTAARTA